MTTYLYLTYGEDLEMIEGATYLDGGSRTYIIREILHKTPLFRVFEERKLNEEPKNILEVTREVYDMTRAEMSGYDEHIYQLAFGDFIEPYYDEFIDEFRVEPKH